MATKEQIELSFRELNDAMRVAYQTKRATVTNDKARAEDDQIFKFVEIASFLLESFLIDVKRIAEAQETIAREPSSGDGWSTK